MTEPNLSKMKVAELKVLANESGISLPQKAKKQEIVTIIEAKINEIKAQLKAEGVDIDSNTKTTADKDNITNDTAPKRRGRPKKIPTATKQSSVKDIEATISNDEIAKVVEKASTKPTRNNSFSKTENPVKKSNNFKDSKSSEDYSNQNKPKSRSVNKPPYKKSSENSNLKTASINDDKYKNKKTQAEDKNTTPKTLPNTRDNISEDTSSENNSQDDTLNNKRQHQQKTRYSNNSNNKKNTYNKNRNSNQKDNNSSVNDLLNSEDCGEADGILDVQNDGYGFLRSLKKGEKDVYVSINQIRRFKLRQGDHVKGMTRPEKDNERYLAMLYITEINGYPPGEAQQRKHFDDLTPIFPDVRLSLERKDEPQQLALRLTDLVAPVGKGQRGMIVSPPKAGKTTLLKDIANSISSNYPDMHLIILLIDERPEEVTDMQRSTKGEVVYSTFDEHPENHCRVAEMVLERAKRLVEQGIDVVILLDSITRLARAYNLTVAPSGRTLSGGLDPSALFKPKRFFGAARNLENGSSLTILATALVDTGSRMDDIVYEEFKGTGNMELHLDRKLQERRVFPAVDLYKSGTRREEVLLSKTEIDAIWQVRKLLAGNQETATEQLIDMMAKTDTNDDFIKRLNQWMSLMEKEGYRQPGR